MALTPRDKRMLQILGAVAGLAVAYFLFTSVLGGGDDGEVAIPTGPTGVVVPPTGPTALATPTPTETLPPVVLAGARDPFSTPPELIVSSAAPPGGTSTTSPGGTGTVGPTTTTTTSTFTPTSTTSTVTFPTGTSTTTTTTTSPGGGNGNGNGNGGNPDEPSDRATIGGHEVRLVDIDRPQGRVEVVVDGNLYTVEKGAIFDETFKLVSIQGDCARFLFGDQSFTLCLR